MNRKNYSVVIWWSPEDNEYSAQCLELPGITGGDKDPGKAIKNVFEGVQESISLIEKLGLTLPEPIHGE